MKVISRLQCPHYMALYTILYRLYDIIAIRYVGHRSDGINPSWLQVPPCHLLSKILFFKGFRSFHAFLFFLNLFFDYICVTDHVSLSFCVACIKESSHLSSFEVGRDAKMTSVTGEARRGAGLTQGAGQKAPHQPP